MAPNSRIILTRHAQAEHNVGLDYSIPDAPLTAEGKEQAASLASLMPDLQSSAELIVSSPLKRTLQTTLLGWGPAVTRLGGPSKVVCLPEAQECNGHPCDTGSAKEVLSADPEYAEFNFERLTPEWTSKKGLYAPEFEAWRERSKAVRKFLYERPEGIIVLVAHGDILRWIIGDRNGSKMLPWRNAEVREYKFEGGEDEYLLVEAQEESLVKGFPPTAKAREGSATV